MQRERLEEQADQVDFCILDKRSSLLGDGFSWQVIQRRSGSGCNVCGAYYGIRVGSACDLPWKRVWILRRILGVEGCAEGVLRGMVGVGKRIALLAGMRGWAIHHRMGRFAMLRSSTLR